MKPIRVFTPDIDLLAEIDTYSSLFFMRRFHTIGELEMRINRHVLKEIEDKADAPDILKKGNLLLVGSQLNKVFQIKHREIELNEDGKASENWLIKALSLNAVVGQRITVPPTHTAYDNKQGEAETVMKHYVENNLVNPVDPERKIEQLIIAPNQNRGNSVSWQSRFKNVAEELASISLNSGLGWELRLDVQQRKWVFDVVEGRDLTTSQSNLPPVIFSPQFDSLLSLNYSESELNYKNTAYVAGQGEGNERRIVEVGPSTGLNRHEIFVDARDVPEETEDDPPQPRAEQDIINDLTIRGQQQLNEMLQEQYLEGQVLTHSPFKYEKDYDLGDIVTIQNKDWNVTMEARITEIKEIYEASGFRIEAVFGNNRPTLIQKIKRELAQISGEVRK